MAGRTKHPNKEIEAAVRYAEGEGWIVENASGHPWGTMRCPWNDDECRCGLFCRRSIWSTPRVPEDVASMVRRAVNGCVNVTRRREEAALKAVDEKATRRGTGQ